MFLREKQTKKHKPEANRYEPERKVCFLGKKQAKKHTACVFGEKSKQENINRKLIGMSRREKCVFLGRSKQKNTRRVFLEKKASEKKQNRKDKKRTRYENKERYI